MERIIGEERDLIIKEEYFNKNKTADEVAEILHIPVKTLRYHLWNHKDTFNIRKTIKYRKDIDIDLLKKEYLDNDRTRDELQEVFGITRGNLITLFNNYNIHKLAIEPDLFWKDKNWLYNQYITLGKSTLDISKEFSVPYRSIYNLLVNNNITPRTRPESRHNFAGRSCFLDSYTTDVIYGELLSDGHLTLSTYSSEYSHGTKHLDYLLWLKYLFYPSGIDLGRIYTTYKKIKDKVHTVYCLTSKSYIELKEIRELFYIDNIKIIPNIDFTPTVLRHWYIGDGCLCKGKDLTLSTHCFSEQYIDFALDRFSNLGFSVNKIKAGIDKKGMQKYVIRFMRRSIKDFLDYIGTCPEEIKHIYGYKWDYIK